MLGCFGASWLVLVRGFCACHHMLGGSVWERFFVSWLVLLVRNRGGSSIACPGLRRSLGICRNLIGSVGH